MDNNKFSERDNSPTPNGGDYSIVYFYDKNNKPCEKSVADKATIIEYKSDNTIVNATYLVVE